MVKNDGTKFIFLAQACSKIVFFSRHRYARSLILIFD